MLTAEQRVSECVDVCAVYHCRITGVRVTMLVNGGVRDWSTPVGEQAPVAPAPPNEPIEAPLAPPLTLHTLVSKQNEWFARLTAFTSSPERHEVQICEMWRQ